MSYLNAPPPQRGSSRGGALAGKEGGPAVPRPLSMLSALSDASNATAPVHHSNSSPPLSAPILATAPTLVPPGLERASTAPLARAASGSSAHTAPPRTNTVPHSPVPITGPVPTPDELQLIYASGKARRKAFKDLKVLGAGSEGTVKLALNIETGEKVAIKAMPKPALPKTPGGKAHRILQRGLNASYDSMLQAREKMETQIRKRFYAMKSHSGHPHLPIYRELFETSEKFYVVTALCNGGDLAGYVAHHGGRLDEDVALYVVTVLLRTLAYVHANGITHRDLKPANVFLREPDKLESICIADFAGAFVTDAAASQALQQAGELGDEFGDDVTLADVASAAGSSSSFSSLNHSAGPNMKTLTGTPFYLAPEVVKGRCYSSKVDLWSLGCITFELLFGRTPFQDAGNFHELFSKISEAKFQFPRSSEFQVSDTAKSFVSELLDADPETRLSAAQALQHPWIMGSSTSTRSKRLLSGVQVFWKEEDGALQMVLPADSGVGLEQLSLSDRA